MSFPNMKSDIKSPMFVSKEEDLNPDYEVADKQIVRTNIYRPISASTINSQRQKRPITGKRLPVNPRRENTKNVDLSLLSKLKPRNLKIDKERLYEDNMALKLKNNGYQEEVLKLRTKILQLEKELSKREEQNEYVQSFKPTHLLGNLKNSIKDMRIEILSKNEEIIRLKKNIKSTKIGEIEYEIQAYIDECTRLRHHLEEMMKQKESPLPQVVTDEDPNRSLVVNSLKKEKEQLNEALLAGRDEINMWKSKVAELEKEKKRSGAKKNEVTGLKAEIKRLKMTNEQVLRDIKVKDEELAKQKRSLADLKEKYEGVENSNKDLVSQVEQLKRKARDSTESHNRKERNLNAPKLFRILNKLAAEKKVSIKGLFELIGTRGRLIINTHELYSGLKGMNVKIKEVYISEIIGLIKGKSKNEINIESIEVLLGGFSYRDNDSISSSSDGEMFERGSPAKKMEGEPKAPEFDYVTIELPSFQQKDMNFKAKKPEESFPSKQSELIKAVNKAIEPPKQKEERVEEIKRADSVKKQEEGKILDKNSEKLQGEEKKAHEGLQSVKKQKLDSKAEGKQPPNIETDQDRPRPRPASATKKLEPPKPVSSTSFPSAFVNDLLLHLSFRMQINRLPKSKLYITLFPSYPPDKQLASDEFILCLSPQPFNFTSSEALAISSFIFTDSLKLSTKSIEDKLKKATENWEVFTPEDEASFDEQLGIIISKNKIALKESCKEIDKSNSGIITLSQFETVLKDVAIEFPVKLYKYVLLLFYSHDTKLRQVPYRHFIKAYGESAESEEYDEDEESDDEKAKIVRHYLGIISQILIQNKKTASDVFEYDANGIISAEQFIKGLRRMGLSEIEHEDIMLMLEALQLDEAEDVCVSIEELTEILKHYGVNPVESPKKAITDRSSSANSIPPPQKKSNLLSSVEAESSDESSEYLNRKQFKSFDNQQESDYDDDFQ